MMPKYSFLLLTIMFISSFAYADETILFERDIQPIFEMNCIGCHSVNDPQAGLTLLDHDAVMKGGLSGKVVIPGDSGKSKLYQLVAQVDKNAVMPPKPLLPLSDEEVEKIKTWIDQGAQSSQSKPKAQTDSDPSPPMDEDTKTKSNTNQAISQKTIKQNVEPIDDALLKSSAIGSIAFHPNAPFLAVGRWKSVELYVIQKSSNSLNRMAVLNGHAHTVRALQFSPDGKHLIAAGGRPAIEGELVVWNVEKREIETIIHGHTDCVYGIDFSSDGSILASCSYDRQIILWDTNTWNEKAALKEHTDAVFDIEFSPDNNRLASASADGTVKMWDVKTGKRLFTLSEPTEGVHALAFNPSGDKLAAAGADQMIRIWQLKDNGGKMIVSKLSHQESVLEVKYDPSGKFLYTTAEDQITKAWDTNQFLEAYAIEEQTDWVQALALNSEGKQLALGRYDGSLSLYNAQDGTVIFDSKTSLNQEKQPPEKQEPNETIALNKESDNAKQSDIDDKNKDAQDKKETNDKEENQFLVSILEGNGTYPSALSWLNPKAFVRGATAVVTISGKNLDDVKLLINSPHITAKLLENKKHPMPEFKRRKGNTAAEIVDTGRPHTLKVELDITANARPGIHRLRVQTPLATTNGLVFAVEDRPAVNEKEPNNNRENAQQVEFPAILAGTMNQFGDQDLYTFEAKAGEEWVMDVIARGLGSGLHSVLEIQTPDGQTLASSDQFGDNLDAQLGFHVEQDGTYILKITDHELRSGGFYRLHVTQRPFITDVFPLGGQKETKATFNVKGFNLNDQDTVELDIPAEHSSNTISLPFSNEHGGLIRGIQLGAGDWPEVLENEGNNNPENAIEVTTPVSINGKIHAENDSENDVDYYRFSAKKGERWVVDVMAQQLDSPLDSKIEILHADGSPIEIATVRSVAETFVTLADRDSRSAGIRLDSWADLNINDYMMIGTEILQITKLPDYPDEDVLFKRNSRFGWRYALYGTTPGHHAVYTPAYKVEIHPPHTDFPPNGMPVQHLYAENDDGGPPLYRTDSFFMFEPPADGDYLVKITDTFGEGSPKHAYRLHIRPPQEDFKIYVDNGSPNIPENGRFPLRIMADRFDGFNGPIAVKIKDLPEGFEATEGIILPGEETVSLTIHALENAQTTAEDARFEVLGHATIKGETIERKSSFGMITITEQPDVTITQKPKELVLNPGSTVSVTVEIERHNGFTGRVPIDVRNLPHGVYVMDTGLNGILVTEDQSERTYVIYAEPWVDEIERDIFSIASVETRSPLPNRNVSATSRLKIKKSGQVAQRANDY